MSELREQIEDLELENEHLQAELAMLRSYLHGMCLQIQRHGYFFKDDGGAVGIETGLFYSSALESVTLQEDSDVLWIIPQEYKEAEL